MLFISYAALVLLYIWASKFIQLSIQNASLLLAARNENTSLMKEISEKDQVINEISHNDRLTGLYNRNYFLDILDLKLKDQSCNHTSGLLIMDIDRLSAINNLFGTHVGDFVICEISRRLQLWNTCYATLSRTAGEEFAVHLCGDYSNDDFIDICKKLIETMREPISHNNTTLSVTVTIGLVILHRSLGTARIMLQSAETAHAQAKSQGYGQYFMLDSNTYEVFKRRAQIETLLLQCNPENEFELFYQPQFTVPERVLIGAEALIRWNTKEFGYIPPSTFIPIAEEIGVIDKIGRWVIKEAFQQIARWKRKHQKPFVIGINVSPLQIKNNTLAGFLVEQLVTENLTPDTVDIEITESTMLTFDAAVREFFTQIADAGFSLSIDDFGTGHASFGYLSTLRVQRIKIDKLLIDNLCSGNVSGIYVIKGILDLARMLKIRTIAEGVEDENQLALLLELGCDEVQGYLLGLLYRLTNSKKAFYQFIKKKVPINYSIDNSHL
jgi:diguanylate cyclase (GGDEF)-like protein